MKINKKNARANGYLHLNLANANPHPPAWLAGTDGKIICLPPKKEGLEGEKPKNEEEK